MPEEKLPTPDELDKLIFYSPSSPKPDFDYWGKMPYWEIDEALYLTFGICPESDYDPPKIYDKEKSPVSKKVRKLGKILRRARKVKELTDPVKPSTYVEWLKKYQIDVPKQLQHLAVNTNDGTTTKTEENITPLEKPLHTKEKETLLKMIAGMAVDAYGYDPSAKRSPIPKEIADILTEHGISLDQDTVRKWLKEASELLPQSASNTD